MVLAIAVGTVVTGVASAAMGVFVLGWVQEVIDEHLPRVASELTFVLLIYAVALVVVVLVGLFAAVLVASWGYSPSPNLCRWCGYNLTGNVSGRCPECGEAT